MFYTYVIESIGDPAKKYVGHTANLKRRLAIHNSGGCTYTSKFRPWRIRAYFAFQEIEIARGFERYLKSGSGHAFANRHFWPKNKQATQKPSFAKASEGILRS